MNKSILFFLPLLAIYVSSTFPAQAESSEEKHIRTILTNKFPQAKITNLEKTALPGIYEVEMPPHIFYISNDGKYVLNGDLIDLSADRNLTQEKQGKTRIKKINALGEDSMIIFAPKEVKHTISVFTDIDCGYCRKLHSEIGKYNALGIKVRYLSYPRSGPGSSSFKKAESVWCAKDRKQALTDAKNGKVINSKPCDNPVKKHFITGTQVGVTGTPAIFLENGQMLPGYFPADRLLKVLEQNNL